MRLDDPIRSLPVPASRSERSVWSPPVFARSNGWFGENRCAAKILMLRRQNFDAARAREF
ncbi:hypothetical protein C1J03_03735 [Sulfitobacter sp. SK012]|nr:hypothetical protein C1J03_03735 [Sulfitobacter sp. SK012]